MVPLPERSQQRVSGIELGYQRMRQATSALHGLGSRVSVPGSGVSVPGSRVSVPGSRFSGINIRVLTADATGGGGEKREHDHDRVSGINNSRVSGINIVCKVSGTGDRF